VSRFRLYPSPEQEGVLLAHCAHARFVWNLAVEQQNMYTPRKGPVPRYTAQSRQLTEARGEFAWLAAGSQTVQQQALRDFAQAMANFSRGTHRKPTWRKAGRDEGFRIVGDQAQRVERRGKHVGQVWVPKAGWVRFRWSRQVPEAKSYRVTRDHAGRWFVAFAFVPEPVPAPSTGAEVGMDRGITVSAALSNGELLSIPRQRPAEAERLARLQRKLAKAVKGSNRRAKIKARIARLSARQTDRRKDWVEKTSTRLAREYDLIAIEDLKISAMTRTARGSVERPGRNVRRKAGLNRGILANGWGLMARRLEDKAPGRVVRVPAAYTSVRCNACGEVDRASRESQAVFRCRSCRHTAHADVNAARNIRDIAAGRAVTARGGTGVPGPVNREPQLELTSSAGLVG
jgi:transposase